MESSLRRPRFSTVCLLSLFTAACSGSTAGVLDSTDDGGSAKNADTGATPAKDGAPSGSSDGGGPVVTVHLVSVQTPEGSGTTRETPVDQRVGIRGLTLLKSETDDTPLVVFERSTPLDTPYNDDSDTVLGSAPASALTPATYAFARVAVDYVKFTVAGTYHYEGDPIAGDFTDLIALTSGSTVGGAVRQRGWWTSSFSVAGKVYGTTSGLNADIGQPAPGSNLELDVNGAVAAYVFPIHLTIPAGISQDQKIVFTVNTYEDFHWTDANTAGYLPNVFDVSSTGFETVTQLGANSFTVSLQATGTSH